MKNVRRFFSPGNTYFLTHVTFERKPLLADNIDLLWKAINKYKKKEPFDLIAWAIMPDHWHVLLDPKQNNVSDLMKRIKLSFAQQYLKSQGQKSGRTWHNRFWDHMIRDDEDMIRHLDYIHYNPVKHGFVQLPIDYDHTSFGRFVEDGMYHADWGCNEVIESQGEFGE